jgi:peroxiredoxin
MSTISEQVSAFNTGFTEQVGPAIAAVFAAEQDALVATGTPAGAVAVGATVPDASLLTPDNAAASLYAVIGDGPAVLVFYRGAWCPYCNIALRHYQAELLPALRERGVGLVAISPQTPDGSAAIADGASLEFAVLSDPGNALVRDLGILTEPSPEARAAHAALSFDVADSNADHTGDIPFPTVLVVDAGRVVTFASVHVDYTTRTEIEPILAAVDSLLTRTAG